jgi:hypothetical protein
MGRVILRGLGHGFPLFAALPNNTKPAALVGRSASPGPKIARRIARFCAAASHPPRFLEICRQTMRGYAMAPLRPTPSQYART